MSRLLTLSLTMLLVITMRIDDACAIGVCKCRSVSDQTTLVDRTKEHLEAASTVFAGRVQRVVKPDSGRAVAFIEVQRVWKGEVSDTTSIVFHQELPAVSGCDIELRPKDEYLFFRSQSSNGLSEIQLCSGTRPLAGADSILRVLGPGRSPG